MKTKHEISSIMASRLKKLRESRNLSHDKLSKAIAENYEEYGISISRDSLINYEKVTEKNLGMRAECLWCLADFYGVSADYLLGIANEKTPDTDARAVMAYTGLSEKNVNELHTMAQHLESKGVTRRDGDTICLDGNKPFVDCLNDLMEAIYTDKTSIIELYIRLRRASQKNENVDLWYITGECCGAIPGFEPNSWPNLQNQFSIDNEQVEYLCMKIAKTIEESFLKKYFATSEDRELLLKQLEDLHVQNETLMNDVIRRESNGTH